MVAGRVSNVGTPAGHFLISILIVLLISSFLAAFGLQTSDTVKDAPEALILKPETLKGYGFQQREIPSYEILFQNPSGKLNRGEQHMSRVGKKPITIPDKTKISYVNRALTVEGEKGKLSYSVHSAVDLKIEDGVLSVTTVAEDRRSGALQGLTRSLVANMITGVTKGFERDLEVNGIGYRAELSGDQIIFNVGYSNPVAFNLPEGVTAAVAKNNNIKLSGIDKQKIGLAAAAIRRIRPPEPYKGKGIKYAEEHIRRKAGKTGTK